jgi:uncharacterized protein DUF6262
VSADHTDRLAEHARHRHHDTVRRAHEALAELANSGQSVTIARLADKAGVSRSWIYTQPELRERVEQLQRRFTEAGANRATVTRASDESLRSRLAVALAGRINSCASHWHTPTVSYAQPGAPREQPSGKVSYAPRVPGRRRNRSRRPVRRSARTDHQ